MLGIRPSTFSAAPSLLSTISANWRITPRFQPVAMASSAPSSQGCYIGETFTLTGSDGGPLAGMAAVVKDSYDIAGHPTGNGHPLWLETHPVPTTSAPAVQSLLQAGVTIIGKTIMDELAYSLQGNNSFYGTPTNAACPDRLPGGSSSGAAAAVAAGDADIGLGGDTGGSVRVPASFCGLLGLRPTHGRVNLQGSCALAPSFDTGGWFARDPEVFKQVGDVLLLSQDRRPTTIKRWMVATDAFDLADKAATEALYNALQSNFGDVCAILGGGSPQEVELASGTEGGLGAWANAFRVHQAREIWLHHGPWITQHQPSFGPGIEERFQAAAAVTNDEYEGAVALRAAVCQRMETLLGDDAVVLLPVAPSAAPLLTTSNEDMDVYRGKLLRLTCIAGLSGLPQVSLPIAEVDGCPLGLGIIAPKGADEQLLEMAEHLMALLKKN